jgi:hypothetical protein
MNPQIDATDANRGNEDSRADQKSQLDREASGQTSTRVAELAAMVTSPARMATSTNRMLWNKEHKENILLDALATVSLKASNIAAEAAFPSATEGHQPRMVELRYLGVRDPIETMEGLLPAWDYISGLAGTYGPGDRHRAPYQEVHAALNALSVRLAGIPLHVERGHEPGRENLPSIARLIANPLQSDEGQPALLGASGPWRPGSLARF